MFLIENMRLTRAEPENAAFAEWLQSLFYDEGQNGLITLPQGGHVFRDEIDLFNHVYMTTDHQSIERPPEEYLHSMKGSGMPPPKLKLKIGAPIILLRNTSPETGMRGCSVQ